MGRTMGAAVAAKKYDTLMLDMIFKLLKSESFDGTMYALNELKRTITEVRTYW